MSFAAALGAILLTTYLLVAALDLGAGLLLPLVTRGRDRNIMLQIAGHPWSSGAIWTLIAFSIVVAFLPASLSALRSLWVPLGLMLALMSARGLAFALRPVVLRQDLIDVSYGIASLVAVCCQGLMVGWCIDNLGQSTFPSDVGPLSFVSFWGVLMAFGLVGAYALAASGWIIAADRGAVSVFGREVGRAAALVSGGATIVSVAWSVPSGVAARAAARGPGWCAVEVAVTLAVLGFIAHFLKSLWGRHPQRPAISAFLAAVAWIVTVIALPWLDPIAMSDAVAGDYLGFILLLGLPVMIVVFLRQRHRMQRGNNRAKASGDFQFPMQSQVGRRAGSLANHLHLS